MSESGIWKTVESSCFDRLKLLLYQQLSRHNAGGSLEEMGGSDGGWYVSVNGDGTPGKDRKRDAELVEEMEPKCCTCLHEITSLRQLQLMEKEVINETGLASIQKDLEARQISARKKVRCRQHRLNCVLAMFDLEADSIISQLESYEGTEVDFSSSNRVMRLKGMLKEAILTAENLGSAKREVITVELISGSCGLLRKLLSRLDEPLAAQPIDQKAALQPGQWTTVAEAGDPSEIEDDEGADQHPTQSRCEVQITDGCGGCIALPGCGSVMDDKTMAIGSDDMPCEGDDDSGIREAAAATSTSDSSSSFSSSTSSASSAVDSCTSARISALSVVSPSSFSFFCIPFLGPCSYYSWRLLSSLLSLLSSFLRATFSERRLRLLLPATPQFAQKLVKGLKGFLRDMDWVKEVSSTWKQKDEVKNRTGDRSQENAAICAISEGREGPGSRQNLSIQWIRCRLESVYEGKIWNRLVHQTVGWMSSATARISVLLSMPVKMKWRGWKSFLPGQRCAGWMMAIALNCVIVCSLSIICFDQSPTALIRMIGRMIKWIMFDPVVDLRHRGLPPI